MDRLSAMEWTHIKMFSVEFTGLHRESGACTERILRFLHTKLWAATEIWVGLADDHGLMSQFFAHQYAGVTELRIIGKLSDGAPMEFADVERIDLPQYGPLSVVYLDGPAAQITSVAELVRRSRQTLVDMNIGEYSVELAETLGIRPPHTVEYPQLTRLAISNSADDASSLIDGSAFPQLLSLYFSESVYPSSNGRNTVSDFPGARLTHSTWPQLQCLAVDGLSQGDVANLPQSVPCLTALSVGTLGSDVSLGDSDVPAPPLDLVATGHIIGGNANMTDLRIEVPEAYEDMYNNSHDAGFPAAPRPFDPHVLIIDRPQTALRHLTLNTYALTFDQLTHLLAHLPNLASFEGNVQFTSRFPCTLTQPLTLAQLSIAHTTVSKYRHTFKSNLLKFLSQFTGLRTLEVYGELEIAGLELALQHVAPGCQVGVFPLIPSWLLDYMDEGSDEDSGR
ncbi:hypothetical protein FBU59_000842 [Linderina macrospora]|uniref:Uncharacterized protein n=1 Tax=Linderina macrospora TaxID=4868 RepID=A0ACC1JFN7_9FUNG|nr:hypothetical protein FBU59_000842 [Linderina macrospora]